MRTTVLMTALATSCLTACASQTTEPGANESPEAPVAGHAATTSLPDSSASAGQGTPAGSSTAGNAKPPEPSGISPSQTAMSPAASEPGAMEPGAMEPAAMEASETVDASGTSPNSTDLAAEGVSEMESSMETEGPESPAVPVPKIPEPMGECPSFQSGTSTIGGLRTIVEAGTPGERKGALLFAWHFTAGSARAAMSGVPRSVRNEITEAGGIVVAPQGNVRGAGRTDIAPPTGAWFLQDLDYADLVVACAVKDHNIDPNRIYATGCSAGGLMSGTFGLMRSEYVAAVAPNSGGINFQASRKLSDTSHGPAAFSMHGGGGDNVIVNFGETSGWFEDQNRMAASKPFMVNCDHGRGHCGAPSSLHELAWEFMKAHPYNVMESPWASSPPDMPSYCKVVE